MIKYYFMIILFIENIGKCIILFIIDNKVRLFCEQGYFIIKYYFMIILCVIYWKIFVNVKYYWSSTAKITLLHDKLLFIANIFIIEQYIDGQYVIEYIIIDRIVVECYIIEYFIVIHSIIEQS